ncbi:MAG: HNH endonuclease [Planctomycetota bacterium]
MKVNLPYRFDHICTWLILTYYRFRFGHSVRFIHIKKFRFAIVDPYDYDRLRRYKWRINRSNRTFYAFCTLSQGPILRPQVLWMHHLVLPPPDGLLVDHRNHNGLDNRRSNLRLATHSENIQNARKTKSKTSSRYKGVDFVKTTGKYRARIAVADKRLFLGSFSSELDAAKAYDEAAIEYFKEYACLNFPKKKN